MDHTTIVLLLNFCIYVLVIIDIFLIIIRCTSLKEENNEPLKEVSTWKECKEENRICYSINRNITKISCSYCVQEKVNARFV